MNSQIEDWLAVEGDYVRAETFIRAVSSIGLDNFRASITKFVVDHHEKESFAASLLASLDFFKNFNSHNTVRAIELLRSYPFKEEVRNKAKEILGR